MSGKASRSKFAIDVMYRLWDEHHSRWVMVSSRSIWVSKRLVEKLRDRLIEAGRNPDHLVVERVFVEVR